jgi:hypothetical protein
MFYKVLGILVWNGAKVVLRRKYGPTYLPAPVLAGVVVLGAAVVGLALAKRSD